MCPQCVRCVQYKISPLLQGPRPFPLDRMLAIFRHIFADAAGLDDQGTDLLGVRVVQLHMPVSYLAFTPFFRCCCVPNDSLVSSFCCISGTRQCAQVVMQINGKVR